MFDVNEKITSSQNTEEDSLQVFRRAVNNGQTRLALEALVDVIDAIVEILTPDEEEQEQEQEHVEIKQPAATVEIKEEKLETPVVPVTSTKKKTKETTTDTAE
jgi:hypothetical protein